MSPTNEPFCTEGKTVLMNSWLTDVDWFHSICFVLCAYEKMYTCNIWTYNMMLGWIFYFSHTAVRKTEQNKGELGGGGGERRKRGGFCLN